MASMICLPSAFVFFIPFVGACSVHGFSGLRGMCVTIRETVLTVVSLEPDKGRVPERIRLRWSWTVHRQSKRSTPPLVNEF